MVEIKIQAAARSNDSELPTPIPADRADGKRPRHGYAPILLLGLSLLLTACKESPRWAKAGTFFSAEEKASPDKAVVYVYWPRGERGGANQLFVNTCGNFENNAVLPGGYNSFVVEPGPSCFQAERQWEFAAGRGSADEDLGKVEIKSEPGHSYFIRLERKRVLFLSRFALRRIEPAAAEPEIRKCRRSVPLSLEEIASRAR